MYPFHTLASNISQTARSSYTRSFYLCK